VIAAEAAQIKNDAEMAKTIEGNEREIARNLIGYFDPQARLAEHRERSSGTRTTNLNASPFHKSADAEGIPSDIGELIASARTARGSTPRGIRSRPNEERGGYRSSDEQPEQPKPAPPCRHNEVTGQGSGPNVIRRTCKYCGMKVFERWVDAKDAEGRKNVIEEADRLFWRGKARQGKFAGR
jgi:hypothetical protein